MSSLFDVPLHLAMLLTLVATDGVSPPTRLVEPVALQTSASGPYRFSEQVWLGAVMAGAGGDRLAEQRPAIFKTSSGRHYVPAEARRNEILGLRQAPDVAARVAFDLARSNATALKTALGHPASAGDLYVAHALGLDAATRLLRAAARTPAISAETVIPDLAMLNPRLLSPAGYPLTASELVQLMTRSFPQPPNRDVFAPQSASSLELAWAVEVADAP